MIDASLIITGGDAGGYPPPFGYRKVIAADSGYDTAKRLGIGVDLVVGDLDSTSLRPEIEALGFSACPRDKDQSDTELAVMALETGEWDLLGGGGGRIDHMADICTIFCKYSAPRIWLTGADLVLRCDGQLDIQLPIGSDISFFSFGGSAQVSCRDLVWPLDNYVLDRKTTSLSNRNTVGAVSVRSRGLCFVRVDAANAPFVLERL